VTGGQAKSPLWSQVRADITGRNILVPEVMDSELLGDAIVALYALGRYPTLEAAAESLVRIRRTYRPQPELKASYDGLFRLYRQAYAGLKEVFSGLAGIRLEEEA
jgi:sugar (pentulose or hexulose) kinase